MSTAIFPSVNGWITPRTTEVKIDSNNCMVIFPQKVTEIKRVLINATGITVTTGRNAVPTLIAEQYYTAPSDSARLQYLDISKYVVEKAKYDTLPLIKPVSEGNVVRELSINNAQYYVQNETTLYIANQSIKTHPLEWFKNVTVWNMTIAAAFKDMMINGELYYKELGTGEFKIANSYIGNVDKMTNNPMTAQFRVYYTPLGESINLETPKTNPQPTQFAIPYSQQQPIVDNVTHGREIQSIANRTGCEKHEVVRTFHDFKEYRDPHDHWYSREKDENGNYTGNVWVLTGTTLEIYCETMFRVVETWSKNWSYRSENAPINREFRSWNIPADIVQRNLHWNDYCLITRKDVDLTNTKPVLLSDIAKTEFMRGFDGSKSNYATECNNMWFYKKDNSGNVKGAVMSCSTFGFANALVFSGKTKDNLSAGMQRVKSDDGDSNYQFCKDVYYCNEDGKIDEMYVQFGAGISDNDPYLYPECYLNDDGQKNLYAANDVVYLFDEHKFKILKDPCEQLNFTYQLHLLTDDGFLVIGSTLASNNPLVKERDKPQTIKVWKLTQYIPQGAQVMTPIYGTEQDNSLFSVVVDSANPSITFNPAGTTNDGVGVCVTDENNAVLIAFNDNSPATFKIKFTHEYKAIARAIKR